jgi:hypothetical protein
VRDRVRDRYYDRYRDQNIFSTLLDRLSKLMIAWVKYDGIQVANKIMFNVSSTLDFLKEISNNNFFYSDSENKMM